MTSASQTRANRITQLRRMKTLHGATWNDLKRQCMAWGISDSTARSYLRDVEQQIKIIIERRKRQNAGQ